jgi:GNAT superfamily N-acetyltransferase
VNEVRQKLIAALPLDHYLRIQTDGRDLAAGTVRGGCVGFTTRHWTLDTDWSTVLGTHPDAIASIAAGLIATSEAAGHRTSGLTISRVGVAAVSARTGWLPQGDWDWWLTHAAPGEVPGEELVVHLAPDDPRLNPLLSVWSPRRSVEVGDQLIDRWLGIVVEGRLVAAAADTRRDAGVPHLAGVVTDGRHRGRGYATAICARLTRDAILEGQSLVTLSTYTDNEAARKVYQRLGFQVAHQFASGPLRC